MCAYRFFSVSLCTFSKISTYRVNFVIRKKCFELETQNSPVFWLRTVSWTKPQSLCLRGKACHNLAPLWLPSPLFLLSCPEPHMRGLLSHEHVHQQACCSPPLPLLPLHHTQRTGLSLVLLDAPAVQCLVFQLLKRTKFFSPSGPFYQLYFCLDGSSHDHLLFIFQTSSVTSSFGFLLPP